MRCTNHPLGRSFVGRLTVYTLLTSFILQSLSIGASAVELGSARAAADTSPGTTQRSNSLVLKLLRDAALEENPARAIEILKLAREEIKKEGFSREVVERLIANIEALEKIQQAKIERQKASSGSAQTSSSTTYSSAKKLSVVASLSNGANAGDKEIEKALSENPEIRDTMWEIGRSRLSRDTDNLSAIVKERSGQTPDQIDSTEAQNKADLNKPNDFLAILSKFNLLKLDFTKANLQLKQEYEGTSLDIIADKLTHDAAVWSGLNGTLRGSLALLGNTGKIFGITSEYALNYVVNAKLVLQIADLYGIQLSESEQQTTLLLAYVGMKSAAKVAMSKGVFANLMSGIGTKFAAMKYDGKVGAFVSWMQSFMSKRVIAEIAAPAISGGTLITAAEAKAPNAAQAAPAATKFARIRAIGSRINMMGFIVAGKQGLMAAGETLAMGEAAKYFFRSAREKSRKIHNDNFRRFLMTPTGEGFIKLLVLAMNDGTPSIAKSQNVRSEAELKAKAAFITNIARSARVCSDDDLKAYIDAKATANTTELQKYACGANPNTQRFDRIKSEFLTFDAIPQDYIADLRTASRQNRLRMGDLVLQMQFIDGDRSPSEVQFFKSVIAKALGFDNKSDLDYYDRLHAYIQENGGMARAPDTPTGVTIGTGAMNPPYNMDRGYSPLNAPEPAPEFVEVVPTSKSTTITPSPAKPVKE